MIEKRKILIIAPFRKSDVDRMEQAIPEEYSITFFKEDLDDEALKRELKDAEIVIGQPPLEILQDTEKICPKLKLIQMTWAGTDIYTRGSMDFPKDKIMLANASGAFGMIMSQFVIGMLLSLLLNFKEYHNQQQKRIWARSGSIQSLDRCKALIFGAGDIGTSVAKRLTGFDAYCVGVCRDTGKKREYFNELCTLAEAERYIPEADVIIGCMPNTCETVEYLNRQRLSLMKKNAVLVNVGRGNFVDCMALDELLRENAIWGAALDVTNPEPLPEEHPLWSNPRCMITPHTSGTTFGQLEATETLLCDLLCENLSRYCGGKEILNRVY